MPNLKAYTNDSAKSGHYILANVGGNHPITIQVTDLGERVLQKAGYSSGDNVPTKVVWSMFDIGILYTSGTIRDPPETVEDPDETFRQLGVANKLTPKEQSQLLEYLNEYTGPNQDEVDTLRETLEPSTKSAQRETNIPTGARDDLDRLSNLHKRGDLKPEEYELLKSRILDNYSTPGPSHRDSTSTQNSAQEQDSVEFDIFQAFWNIIPDDKYEKDIKIVSLRDNSADDSSLVGVSYMPNKGFKYKCFFHQQSHEERLFELLEDDLWEMDNNSSDISYLPHVDVIQTTSQGGFQDDHVKENVKEEVKHLLELIQTVYETTPSIVELSSVGDG